MKKYFILWSLIASCNGLSNSTVYNINGQGSSNEGASNVKQKNANHSKVLLNDKFNRVLLISALIKEVICASNLIELIKFLSEYKNKFLSEIEAIELIKFLSEYKNKLLSEYKNSTEGQSACNAQAQPIIDLTNLIKLYEGQQDNLRSNGLLKQDNAISNVGSKISCNQHNISINRQRIEQTEEGASKDDHIGTQTGERPHKCNVCGKGFGLKYDLKKHIRIHTGERPYKCQFCDKRFSQKSNLNTHIKKHTDKAYKCSMCDQTFNFHCDVKRHMRIHTGERPYECQLCNSTFSQKSNLTTHIKKHTDKDKRPYKCSICDQTFNFHCDVKRHIRIHTGERPYKCQLCNSRFTQKSNLTIHMRKHTGEKLYKCKTCPEKFQWGYQLKKHISSDHLSSASDITL